MHAVPPSAPDQAGPSWVRSGTSNQPPLVAVHTWRGEDWRYGRLSAAMGAAPIVSLLPPRDGTPLPRRTEQWVDHHEAALRAAGVDAPYRFVGWSYGGVVALELARRLRDAGDEVSFVGMIDTIRPRLAPLDAREYAWYHLGAAAAIADARERIPYLRRRVKPLLHRMAPRWSDGTRQMMQRAGLRRSAPPPREKPTDPLMVSVHTAYLNYHPTPVTFPVSLFATRQSMARAVEPALRWNGWLHAGFELVEIPGHHATLWDDEHVGSLAAALRASLARRRDAAGC